MSDADIGRSSKQLADGSSPTTLKERLEGIAEFVPIFEDPNFTFGEWQSREETLGWYSLSQDASRFVRTASALGWVSPEVDWVRWKDTVEAQRFVNDPEAVASATPDDLVRVLTTLIRQDRFVEGALGHAFEAGMPMKIVRRAETLQGEIDT